MTTTGQSDAGAAIAAVRYQIKDVDRAIKFYTELFDFKLEHKAGVAFAMISRGALQLVLSGPGSSGARPMPDGRRQEPGGWNRIILYVSDLDAQIKKLETIGARFRNTVEVGPGGKQNPDRGPRRQSDRAARRGRRRREVSSRGRRPAFHAARGDGARRPVPSRVSNLALP